MRLGAGKGASMVPGRTSFPAPAGAWRLRFGQSVVRDELELRANLTALAPGDLQPAGGVQILVDRAKRSHAPDDPEAAVCGQLAVRGFKLRADLACDQHVPATGVVGNELKVCERPLIFSCSRTQADLPREGSQYFRTVVERGRHGQVCLVGLANSQDNWCINGGEQKLLFLSGTNARLG